MTIITTTHLNFRGTARAALEFYQSVFGGDLSITRYRDVGMPTDAPGAENVVFGQLESDSGFRVMAYDIPGASPATDAAGAADAAGARRENGVTLTDQPFFLSVRGDTLDEAQRYWAALAAGAAVIEPLAASAWSPGFCMLTDRFGVTWVIDVAAAE